MFATIRRYDGVDQNRSAELTRKVNEMLVPKLEKLSGFAGYWLVEADNGVFSSLSLFETPEQSKESTKIVASWIRDEKLDTMIPNEPKITSGKVVAHSDRVLVAASLDRTAFGLKLGARLAGPHFVCRAAAAATRASGARSVELLLHPPGGAASRSNVTSDRLACFAAARFAVRRS